MPKFPCVNKETLKPPVRNSTTSDVMNAKWRAGTSTRVLINPNQKHALKTCEHTHPNMKEASSGEMYISDKTSCTGSVDRLMRLISRGDNPNKEILIYIPYTSCLHRLSTHIPRCPQ